MTMRREQLTKAEAVTVAGIETGVPALAAARALLDRFRRMLRARDTTTPTPWVIDSETSLLASFCKGIRADLAATRSRIISTSRSLRPMVERSSGADIWRIKTGRSEHCH